MLGPQYFAKVEEISSWARATDAVKWVGLFHDFAGYADNEFYGEMLKHRLTGSYPSVLARRFYDQQLRGRVESDLNGFLETHRLQSLVVELTKTAWEASQDTVDRVSQLSREYGTSASVRFYHEAYKAVKGFVDDAFHAAETVDLEA